MQVGSLRHTKLRWRKKGRNGWRNAKWEFWWRWFLWWQPANNFLVNQQPGVTTTNSIGLNYSDLWWKKVKATVSYFFNNSDNTNYSRILNNNTGSEKAAENDYSENSGVISDNFNHRLSGRFEYTIDTSNSIIVTPKIYFQLNDGSNIVSSIFDDTAHVHQFYNDGSDISGYTTTNNILYRHKFHKKGRTFSLNIEADANEKKGTGTHFRVIHYSYPLLLRLIQR